MDNRPFSSKSTEYQFDLTVIANDAPVFSNLSSFPSEMNSGDTLSFDIDWVDPNEDQTTFNLTVEIDPIQFLLPSLVGYQLINSGWLQLLAWIQLKWENIIPFTKFDECFTAQRQKSLTIN